MVSYEKILAILEEWKETVRYLHERKSFYVEPEVDGATFKISVCITVSEIPEKMIEYSEQSILLTINGLEKEYNGLDEKVFALKKFLNDFTCKFYDKVIAMLEDGDR